MIHTAVILAAGRGTRLAGARATPQEGEREADLTERPKGFITVGSRPIVEESIDALEAAGVREVIIVTGHAAEHYEALARRRRGLVRTIHNTRFAESGSMYSLYRAREAVSGPFLLLESDLVYEPRALSALLACPSPDVILVSGPTHAGDEVYVEARAGALVAMSKRRAELGPNVVGELCGISKISARLFRVMEGISARAFERSLHVDYETDCLVAAAREVPIHCLVVEDLVWGEIDDPSHLARIRAAFTRRSRGAGTFITEIKEEFPTMSDRLELRLANLKEEHEAGQKMLAELDQKRQNLVQTMLRIEGAIQVLTELVEQSQGGSAPATGPGATS